MTNPFIVTILKTVTLLIGATITYFAYRAYQRTGVSSLRMLTIGFGIVTLGSLAAGLVDFYTGLNRQSALIVESLLTAIGFSVVLYSLYVE